jgi:hypothetical protein
MLQPSRIHRLSNLVRGLEAQHVQQAWTAVEVARRTLADHPCPDTFLGRRTQEPFPAENNLKSGTANLQSRLPQEIGSPH